MSAKWTVLVFHKKFQIIDVRYAVHKVHALTPTWDSVSFSTSLPLGECFEG